MKFHLCCNQCEYRWEVRNKLEEVVYYGTLDECEKYIVDNKLDI